MLLLGFLFGLGFDTATEVALFGISITQNTTVFGAFEARGISKSFMAKSSWRGCVTCKRFQSHAGLCVLTRI